MHETLLHTHPAEFFSHEEQEEHSHGHHHNSSVRESYSSNPFVKIMQGAHDKLKSIDGIDETAQVAGQVLPGLAGPIITTTILGVATPFVYLGLLGMIDEYKEACKEFDQIMKSQASTTKKLEALADNTDKWREFLSRKLHLGVKDSKAHRRSAPDKLNLKPEELEKFTYHIAEYEKLRNQAFVAALGKKYGWTGAVGMGGMFLGMLPATASAIIGIVDEVGAANAAALHVASLLDIASSGAFLAGQAAMFVYGLHRYYQGKTTNKRLISDRKQFLKYSSFLNPSTQEAVLDLINKGIRFNQYHSIYYGLATDLGQAAMIGGTTASLMGNPVSVPLFAFGAPTTIIAAIARIIYEAKEEKFKGSNSKYAQEKLSSLNLLSLLTEHAEEDSYAVISQALDKGFTFHSTQLAHIKLYSVLRHIINDKKYKDLSLEEKLARLDKIFNTGHYSYFKGTSLKGAVLDQAKQLFQTYRANGSIQKLLGSDNIQANQILLANLTTCANSTHDKPHSLNTSMSTIDKATLIPLLTSLGLKKTGTFSKLKNGTLEPNDYVTLNKLLVPKLKSSLKYVRHTIANSLVQLAQVQELKSLIAAENVKKEEEEYRIKSPRYSSSCATAESPYTTLHTPFGTGLQATAMQTAIAA